MRNNNNLGKHDKKSCTHCDSHGYRLDFYGIDHYGSYTKIKTRCETGTSPCLEHRCYWWPTPEMLRREAQIANLLASTNSELDDHANEFGCPDPSNCDEDHSSL